MITRILFYFLILFFILITPSYNYQFENCCLNEKTKHNTTRLLSCPLNFVIKLRSVIFYTGNGCARSSCQKRFNKHYLPCNNHRTCSISIQCIHMDSSICPWLTKTNGYSQHLTVDYDCILLNNRTIKKEENDNVVLFSAKVNIESPNDFYNDFNITDDDEAEWKEYFIKKYLQKDKTIIIEQKRSLFSDIIRTIVILLIFAVILIFLMLISLFIYKHIRSMKKRKLYELEKHQPFPSDDAYDNLKTTNIETASDSGTATDV